MDRARHPVSNEGTFMTQLSSEAKDEPRLVLHASMTNLYFVMLVLSVIALVGLIEPAVDMLRGQRDPEPLGMIVTISLILVGGIAYCQKKTRWLIARPSGLTLIERKGIRVIPWRDVRSVDDLGYWGGGPAAKRYYLEFADGSYFTFLGDPEQMLRLQRLRAGWTERSRGERIG